MLDGVNFLSITIPRCSIATSRIALSKCESKARSRDPRPLTPLPITKLKSTLAYPRSPHFVSALAHLLLARSTEQSNVGEMSASKPDLSDLWIQHQRKNTKTTKSWACIFCPNRRVFGTEPDLWEHAKRDHVEQVEARTGDLDTFREEYAAESAQKRLVAHVLGKAPPQPRFGDFSDSLFLKALDNQLTDLQAHEGRLAASQAADKRGQSCTT